MPGTINTYSIKDFKKDCLTILSQEDNSPLVLIWKKKDGFSVSVSSKIKNPKTVADFLANMMRKVRIEKI